MLCKYGKQTHDFGGFSFFLYFRGVFNKTMIPFVLIGFFYQFLFKYVTSHVKTFLMVSRS